MIRNHNNNSLSTPPPHLRYGASKSSESDLSTCTLQGSRLPLPESPRRPSSSPGGPRSAHSPLFRPHTSHLRPPPTPENPHHRGFNGFHGNTSPTASPSSVSSPGAMSVGSGFGGFNGGELAPVALAQTEGDRGLGFSVTAGGPGGRMTLVERVWDRKQCNSLQPGDAIVKINGADVQTLGFLQVIEEQEKQHKINSVHSQFVETVLAYQNAELQTASSYLYSMYIHVNQSAAFKISKHSLNCPKYSFMSSYRYKQFYKNTPNREKSSYWFTEEVSPSYLL